MLFAPTRGAAAEAQPRRTRPSPEQDVLSELEELLASGPVRPALRERLVTLLADMCGETAETAVPQVEAMIEQLQRRGRLCVLDPPAPVRAAWRRAIFAAMQRQLVPDGYQLRHHGRDRGDLVIELQRINPAVQVAPRRLPVTVPDNLDSDDPLVRALQARPAFVLMSPDVRLRALRLVQGLAVAAVGRGYVVDMPSGDEPGVRITVGPVSAVVVLSEEYDMVDYLPDGDELDGPKVYAWQRIAPERRQVPSGRLVLELPDDYRFHGRRRRLADRQRWRLDDKLGHVLAELEHRAAVQTQTVAAARRAAVDRSRAWEAAMTVARAAYTDAHYELALRRQVDDWQRARAARAYVAALIAALTDGNGPGPADPAASAAPGSGWSWWIDRVLLYADGIDPLLPMPQLPTPPPEPEAEQLKPFLDGWSPYGPDSSR